MLPAMMLRSAEGLCLGVSEVLAVVAAMVGDVWMDVRMAMTITNARNELKSYALSKESKKSYLSTSRDSRGRETLFLFCTLCLFSLFLGVCDAIDSLKPMLGAGRF